ncbi:MAG: twin-arginine translocation signal domain-containing protein, partial [Vicinamibacteria bacterium]
MPAITRRRFLRRAASLPVLLPLGLSGRPVSPGSRAPFFRQSSVGAALEAGGSLPTGVPGEPTRSLSIPTLAKRFPDLSRHFVFEYY